MSKNGKMVFLVGLLAIALVLAGCSNPAGSGGGGTTPNSVTYKYPKGDTDYELTITKKPGKAVEYTPAPGDTYILLIIKGTDIKKSTGTVAGYSGGKITLQPSNSTVTFSVETSSEGKVTGITGTITLEGPGGDTVAAPDKPSGGSTGGGGGGGGGGGQNTTVQKSVTAGEFNEYFEGIKDKAGTYVITLTEDLLDYPGILLETANVNITVKGDTANRKITYKYAEPADPDKHHPLFRIENGTLTLENIKVSRSASDTYEYIMLAVTGGAIEIKNGVELTNNNENFYGFGVFIFAGKFIMSGGTIKNCALGVSAGLVGIDERRFSIDISGGTISDNGGGGIVLGGYSENCTVSVKGGTISNNGAEGVSIGGNGNTLTMAGGTISGNGKGVGLYDTGNNFTISGGTIKDNTYQAIFVNGDDCTVNISGGIITGNNGGVYFENTGTGNEIRMTGGEISEDKDQGVFIAGTNNKFIISGGTIKNNGYNGIFLSDDSENCSVNMSGGTISDNKNQGVSISGTGNTFTMSGGVISKNGSCGLALSGSNTGFEKKTGAIIYGGNSGANKNGDGAIFVDLNDDDKNLYRFEDAASNVLYAAKINVAGDGIVPDSQKPATW